MNITVRKQEAWLFGLLALLMAATRFHHFGLPLQLPDASYAVFFLAGFYLRALVFPMLLLVAGLLDYLAIHVGGVSDWCATPAYWFLIPTYAALWSGGRWYATHHRLAWSALPPLAGALLVGSTLAFMISNVSFFLFSGYFPQMSWREYGTEVVQYFPHFLGWTFFYVALAALVHVSMTALQPRTSRT